MHVHHSTWSNHREGQDTLTRFAYTLDAAGNRTSVTEATVLLKSYYFPALGRPELPGGGMAMTGGALEPGEETITYSYDANDRLTGAAYSSGDRYAYTYDPVGNRTTFETTLGGVSDSTSYTYDDGDRIATVDGVPYTHDNRGNLTSDGTWTYTYDGAGRMVRAEKPGSVHTYTYNGDGLLVSETIDGAGTAPTPRRWVRIGRPRGADAGPLWCVHSSGYWIQRNAGPLNMTITGKPVDDVLKLFHGQHPASAVRHP